MPDPKRPLNPQAVQEANQKLWKDHPELNGRLLTLEPSKSETAYRRDWMEAYNQSLARQKPKPPTSGKGKVGSPGPSCPVPKTADLTVRVTRTNDKRPVAGVRIEIDGPTQRSPGTTDTYGECTFRGVAPGEYRVKASKASYSTATAPPPPASAPGVVPLSITARIELQVTVTDAADGRPIPGAAVKISGAQAAARATDPKGVAPFVGIAPGDYKVEASKTDYRSAKLDKVTVSEGKPAGSPPAALKLVGVGKLAGLVQDAESGAGLADVRITVKGRPELHTDSLVPDGRFDLGPLDAGKQYELEARKRDYAVTSYVPAQPVTVRRGQVTNVTIRMARLAVKIRAEDGTSEPPKVMAVEGQVKLKAVPAGGVAGTYQWSTISGLITLQDPTAQVVTVKAGKNPSASPEAEQIQLVFTAAGQSLPAVTHKLGVAKVIFSREPSHPFGYDAYEDIPSLDNDDNNFTSKPAPAMDLISIEKDKTGRVKVEVKGCRPADVYFTGTDTAVSEPAAAQPTANSGVLDIKAKSHAKNDASKIEARVGSATGPVAGTLGVVVLKRLTYEAEFFRVKDPGSLGSQILGLLGVENVSGEGTALELKTKGADLQKGLNDYYKPAVASWSITGGASDTNVRYDVVQNGKLDLEPGRESEEAKRVMAACVSSKKRVFYVHKLRWSYFLAADVADTDRSITIKNYGQTYLGYIGLNKSYVIEDTKGNRATVKVLNRDKATGVVSLTAPIGTAFKTADKAALIWPLGGLGGGVVWVSDVGSEADLNNYVAHELGHATGGLKDVCELDNLMHGGSATGKKLRNRELELYYSTATKEEQWTQLNGR